jgi:hypothetical protein
MAVVDASVPLRQSPPGMPCATRVVCRYAVGSVLATVADGKTLYLCSSLSSSHLRTTRAPPTGVQRQQQGTLFVVTSCLVLPTPIQL